MHFVLPDFVAFVASRVSPRRARHFSLSRQRKVPQRKATRVRVTLRCAKGNLRCSQQAGRPQTRLSPQTCVLLSPPVAALLGTRTREWGAENQYQDTRAGKTASASGSRSLALALVQRTSRCPRYPGSPNPLWLRRAAQGSAEKAGRMFEPAGRVCGSPALREQRRLPRSAAKGTQTPGAPSLCLLSLGEARESESPAGARPGLPRKQKHLLQRSPTCYE